MSNSFHRTRSSNILTIINSPFPPLPTCHKGEPIYDNVLRKTTNYTPSQNLYSSVKYYNNHPKSCAQTIIFTKEQPTNVYSKSYDNYMVQAYIPKCVNSPKEAKCYGTINNRHKRNLSDIAASTQNGSLDNHRGKAKVIDQCFRYNQENVQPSVNKHLLYKNQPFINETLVKSIKRGKEVDSPKLFKTDIKKSPSQKQQSFSFKASYTKSPFAAKQTANDPLAIGQHDKTQIGVLNSQNIRRESVSANKDFLHETIGTFRHNNLVLSTKLQEKDLRFEKKNSLANTIGAFRNQEKDLYDDFRREKDYSDTQNFNKIQYNKQEIEPSQTLIGGGKTPLKNKPQIDMKTALNGKLTSPKSSMDKKSNKQNQNRYQQPLKFQQTSPSSFSFKKKLSKFRQLQYNKKEEMPTIQVQQARQDITLKMDDFNLGQCKGEGRFGKVFIATHKQSGFICAIKQVKKSMLKQIINQFIQQIKIQLFINHPNIVKLYGIFSDIDHIYLLMQFLEQGSLYSLVKKEKRLPEPQAAIKLAEIASGLRYLHSQSIVHRDIKPQNIVMSNGICKICDFGWAAHCSGRRNTYCGTLDYVSPEVLKGQEYDSGVDIWCYGVLAYQIMVGKAPFFNISRQQTMKRIQQCDMSFPTEMSIEAQTFIGNIIKKNPQMRHTIQRISNDDFLTKYKECNFTD